MIKMDFPLFSNKKVLEVFCGRFSFFVLFSPVTVTEVWVGRGMGRGSVLAVALDEASRSGLRFSSSSSLPGGKGFA